MQDIQHVLSDNEMSEKIPEGNDRYGLHRNERNSSAKSL